MNTDKPEVPGNQTREYLKAWGESIGRVLDSMSPPPHPWQEVALEAAGVLNAAPSDRVTVQFEASQHLEGPQGFIVSKADAIWMAALLLGETPEPGAEMNDDHRDALSELFRQFAGAAASALKGLAAGEVAFKWVGLESFPGEPAHRTGLSWSRQDMTPLTLVAELGAPLVASLRSVAGEQAEPSRAAAAVAAPALPSVAAAPMNLARDPKLDMLMDVELAATLRFGERQMALREVLDLCAGSVVELNQAVDAPVELLLGDKIIARGEVVVVDGNYGLRVMEIISRSERIESLRA